MDETELPCPFCKASNTRPIIDADGAWSARCEECGARGPIAADARAALSHWERVTGEKALLRMGGSLELNNAPDGGLLAHVRLKRAL